MSPVRVVRLRGDAGGARSGSAGGGPRHAPAAPSARRCVAFAGQGTPRATLFARRTRARTPRAPQGSSFAPSPSSPPSASARSRRIESRSRRMSVSATSDVDTSGVAAGSARPSGCSASPVESASWGVTGRPSSCLRDLGYQPATLAIAETASPRSNGSPSPPRFVRGPILRPSRWLAARSSSALPGGGLDGRVGQRTPCRFRKRSPPARSSSSV